MGVLGATFGLPPPYPQGRGAVVTVLVRLRGVAGIPIDDTSDSDLALDITPTGERVEITLLYYQNKQ